MKTKKTKIEAIEFENGHVLLGDSFGEFHVKTSDGIVVYTTGEMEEIYNYKKGE